MREFKTFDLVSFRLGQQMIQNTLDLQGHDRFARLCLTKCREMAKNWAIGMTDTDYDAQAAVSTYELIIEHVLERCPDIDENETFLLLIWTIW